MAQFNIKDFPDALYLRFKMAALQADMSLRDYLIRLLSAAVDGKKK